MPGIRTKTSPVASARMPLPATRKTTLQPSSAVSVQMPKKKCSQRRVRGACKLEEPCDRIKPEHIVSEKGVHDRTLSFHQAHGDHGCRSSLAAQVQPVAEKRCIITDRNQNDDRPAPFRDKSVQGMERCHLCSSPDPKFVGRCGHLERPGCRVREFVARVSKLCGSDNRLGEIRA